MADLNQLQRAAEQYSREIVSANREISSLLQTIREIEKLAAEADTVDLRSSFSLKSDLSRLQNEVTQLTSNVRSLGNELSDTNSKIRKALF